MDGERSHEEAGCPDQDGGEIVAIKGGRSIDIGPGGGLGRWARGEGIANAVAVYDMGVPSEEVGQGILGFSCDKQRFHVVA